MNIYATAISCLEPSDHSSTERGSLRRESVIEMPLQVPSSEPSNVNGKRPLQEGTTGGRGRGKRKKGATTTVSPPTHPVHFPVHISISAGASAAEIPIDASFFAAALPSSLPGQTPAYQTEEPPQPNHGNQVVSSKSNLLTPELQIGRCLAGRYKHDQFPRCVACIRKWAGDTCRFQGVRYVTSILISVFSLFYILE